MKTLRWVFAVMAIFGIFGFIACGGDDGNGVTGDKDLTGNITITPNTDVLVNTELTATYSGSEAVNYQWNKDGTPIDGKTTNKLTPAEAGSYTVTVSLAGYNSKTSTAVVVSEEPRNQSTTLTGLFETSEAYPEGYSTTITGYFTDSEWEGVAEKIEIALNDAFNAGPTSGPTGAAWKDRFRTVFGTRGFNIEVVIPPEGAGWSKWKATIEDRVASVLFLGFGELDNNLQQTITDVVTAIASGSPTHME